MRTKSTVKKLETSETRDSTFVGRPSKEAVTDTKKKKKQHKMMLGYRKIHFFEIDYTLTIDVKGT